MRAIPFLTAAAAASLLAGCAAPADAPPQGLSVVAAVYPLQFVAERVGGEHVAVASLTAPGVEPHDVELSPVAVRSLGEADLLLRVSGFQPAVDDAAATAGTRSLDAAQIIALHAEEHHDEHADDDHDHDHGDADPHFWLDPVLLADYADALAAELATLAPGHKDEFLANATSLRDELEALDAAFATGLASCERREIVTGHEAFGYLAEAYDLTQIGIAGLDPDAEPSPARMREVTQLVRDTGATTVFAEPGSGAGVVETVARDAGVTVATLTPVETVGDGDDYLAAMARNLEALKEGLGCG